MGKKTKFKKIKMEIKATPDDLYDDYESMEDRFGLINKNTDKEKTQTTYGFEKALQDIANRYKGLGGGPTSESSVHASKQDIREGYAWFWSDNSDVSNLIQRSREYILEIRDHGDNISLKLDKSGYRGPIYAFRPDRLLNENLGEEENEIG